MGVVDEHWCSRCKKNLDKKKAQYLEMTGINDPAVLGAVCNKDDEPGGKATRFAAGLLCRKCALEIKVENPGSGRKRSLWVFLQHLRHKGNPDFCPVLLCLSWNVCGTFESAGSGTEWTPGTSSGTSGKCCRHCALDLRGKLYCKRRHPGGFEVPQEEAVVEEQKRDMVLETVLQWLENSPQIFKVQKSPNAQKALLKAVGLNPASLLDPDPLLTGADMAPKNPAAVAIARALDGPWKERFQKVLCPVPFDKELEETVRKELGEFDKEECPRVPIEGVGEKEKTT
jgi:hypothetical protein